MSLHEADLYESRIVLLTGEINEESCAETLTKIALLDLSGMAKKQPIVLLINSQGGFTSSAMGLADVIEHSVCPIKTVCIGAANSAGSLILISGKKRYAVPNAEIMIHQSWNEFPEALNHTELMNHAKASLQSHKSLIEFYQRNSKLSKTKLKNLLLKDSYLTAEIALKYGFIDEIGWDLHSWLHGK